MVIDYYLTVCCYSYKDHVMVMEIVVEVIIRFLVNTVANDTER